MLAIMPQRTWPSCVIDFCGVISFVLMLTDLYVLPFILSWNYKSRIHLKSLDLCGIVATGEIFSAGGILFLMCDHLTMDA